MPHHHKFTPLYDRVLIRRVEASAGSFGSIAIPDNAQEPPLEGEVLAIGHGRLIDTGAIVPLSIQQGDRVLFGKYAGTNITIAGEELLIMREEEVLGKIG